MNFFKSIAYAFTSFFKSDIAKKILKYAEEILRNFLGGLTSDLLAKIKYEVAQAEADGGHDKYERVFKAVKESFPGIADRQINFAIEAAVLAVTQIATKDNGV